MRTVQIRPSEVVNLVLVTETAPADAVVMEAVVAATAATARMNARFITTLLCLHLTL
jgi:hypothetical protein